VAAYYAECARNPPNIFFLVTEFAGQAMDLYLEMATLQISVEQNEEAYLSYERSVELAEVGFGPFSTKLTNCLKLHAKHARNCQSFEVEVTTLKRLVGTFKMLHGANSHEYKNALAKFVECKQKLRNNGADDSDSGDQSWILKLG
jgi:hypothetical protein